MFRGFAHSVVVGFLFAIHGAAAFAVDGACCLSEGACFPGTAEACAAAFPTPGAYQGDGSTCATSLCLQQGACCFPDGTCDDLFWGPCDSSTGTFQGDGSSGTPLSLEDARRLVSSYGTHYNEVRLHSAIGYVAPKDKLEGREVEIFAQRDRKLEAVRQQRRAVRHQVRNKAWGAGSAETTVRKCVTPQTPSVGAEVA